MIGETAQLITELLLKDQLSSGVATAESKLGGLNATAGKTGAATSLASSGLSRVEGAARKVGGAMSHAAGQISGLVSNLGLFGGAGAALAGAGFLEQGISLAEQDATALENLRAVSSDTTDQLSGLLAVTNKYGISASSLTSIVDKTEKNIGKLSMTTATATKVQASAHTLALEQQKIDLQAAGSKTTAITKLITEAKAQDALNAAQTGGVAPANKLVQLGQQYGVTLTDQKGKALGFTDLLLNVADAYSKNADKAQAAALAAGVFTKGYAPLIPILELGRKGYLAAQQQAVAFGLTLTQQNVQDLAKFKDASNTAHQALSGLELQLGLAFMPDLSTAMEAFAGAVKNNLPEIESGFHDVLGFAEQVGGAITDVVIPAIQMIGGVWNSLPGPIKELLIGGFLANKAVKWTFGIDVAGLAGKALGGAISNLFKNATTAEMAVEAGIVNVGGAGAAVGGAETMAEGEAMGLAAGPIIATALTAALALGLAYFADDIQNLLGTDYAHNQNLPLNQLSWPWGPKNTPHLDIGPFKNILGGDSSFTTPTGPSSSGGTGGNVGSDLYPSQTGGLKAVVDTGSAAVMARAIANGLHPTAAGIDATLQKNLGNIAVLIGDTNTILGKEWGSTSSKEAAIAARAAAAHGGKAPGQAAIDATFNRDLLREMTKIEGDGHTTSTKITDLQRLQALAVANGDTKTAAKITTAITNEQAILKRAIDGTTQAINLKQFIATGILGSGSLTGNTPTLHVTTTVSNRQNETASAYSNRYGPTPVHQGAQ